jgi:hypothetical protein
VIDAVSTSAIVSVLFSKELTPISMFGVTL